MNDDVDADDKIYCRPCGHAVEDMLICLHIMEWNAGSISSGGEIFKQCVKLLSTQHHEEFE